MLFHLFSRLPGIVILKSIMLFSHTKKHGMSMYVTPRTVFIISHLSCISSHFTFPTFFWVPNRHPWPQAADLAPAQLEALRPNVVIDSRAACPVSGATASNGRGCPFRRPMVEGTPLLEKVRMGWGMVGNGWDVWDVWDGEFQ